jgi:hypothetical protein
MDKVISVIIGNTDILIDQRIANIKIEERQGIGTKYMELALQPRSQVMTCKEPHEKYKHL